MIPRRAIPLAEKTSLIPFQQPGIKAGCSIEDQQGRALNNLSNFVKELDENEKWERERNLERIDEERAISRAGHTKTTGPVSYLCWWYFESKIKRQLKC
jgi:hypothetical protein